MKEENEALIALALMLATIIAGWGFLVADIQKTNSHRKQKHILVIILSIIVALGPALLIMGSQIYYSNIEEYEAETIIVHYSGYHDSGTARDHTFVIYFTDHDAFRVAHDRKVKNEIKELSIGSELTIQVNPRCNFLMSIRYGYKNICTFDDGLEALSQQRIVWLVVGVLEYLFFAFCLYVFEKEDKIIIKIGRIIIGRNLERYSKKTIEWFFNNKNEKNNRVSDDQMTELWQMSWEELIDAMYDRDTDKLNGEPVKLVYNKERDRRFAVLKVKKGYSYTFQRLCKYEEADWFSINAIEGGLPAAWECVNEQEASQIFKSEEEALLALKKTDEYKVYYEGNFYDS